MRFPSPFLPLVVLTALSSTVRADDPDAPESTLQAGRTLHIEFSIDAVTLALVEADGPDLVGLMPPPPRIASVGVVPERGSFGTSLAGGACSPVSACGGIVASHPQVAFRGLGGSGRRIPEREGAVRRAVERHRTSRFGQHPRRGGTPRFAGGAGLLPCSGWRRGRLPAPDPPWLDVTIRRGKTWNSQARSR